MSEERTAASIARELVEKILDVYAKYDVLLDTLELRQDLFDMVMDEMVGPESEASRE